MQIPKPTDADKERFRSLVPDDPAVEVKPMFGNLGAFVNGNMFMGLFGADVGVKLADADQEALRKAGGGPFGPEVPAMTRHGEQLAVGVPDGVSSHSPDRARCQLGSRSDFLLLGHRCTSCSDAVPVSGRSAPRRPSNERAACACRLCRPA